MDGDRLSIAQSRDFTEQSPVQWLLDDAHGIGVIPESTVKVIWGETNRLSWAPSPLEKRWVPVGRRLLAVEMTSTRFANFVANTLFDCDATDAGGSDTRID